MTMPAGRYYVGDLCYVIGDDAVWSEICELTMPYNHETKETDYRDGEFTLKDGRRIVIYSTKYGDGGYRSNLGTYHAVDAGVIGAMLESECDKKYEHIAELGAFVDFPEPWEHSGGRWTNYETWDGVIHLGHVTIATGDSDEDFVDEDQEQEA